MLYKGSWQARFCVGRNWAAGPAAVAAHRVMCVCVQGLGGRPGVCAASQGTTSDVPAAEAQHPASCTAGVMAGPVELIVLGDGWRCARGFSVWWVIV